MRNFSDTNTGVYACDCFVKNYSFVNSIVKISQQNLKCNYFEIHNAAPNFTRKMQHSNCRFNENYFFYVSLINIPD